MTIVISYIGYVSKTENIIVYIAVSVWKVSSINVLLEYSTCTYTTRLVTPFLFRSSVTDIF